MDDIINRSGHHFGTTEALMLIQLSLSALPTAFVVFLELMTNEMPEVCILRSINASSSECVVYPLAAEDVCRMSGGVEWGYTEPLATIIGTYDLLCQSHWERCMPQLLFYLGMLPSCIAAGLLSDVIGRKRSLLLFLLLEGVTLAMMIAVRGFAGYLVLRFMTGASIGYLVNCLTLLIEGLKVEYRHSLFASVWCSFSLGTALLGLVSMLFSRYIDVLACVVVYIGLLLCVYLVGIEESLRWLLLKRKEDRARYLLNKIAYRNKVVMPRYEDIPKPEDDYYSLLDLFRLNQSKAIMSILLLLSLFSFYLLVEFTHMSVDRWSRNEDDAYHRNYGFESSELARTVNFVFNGVTNLVGVVATAGMCMCIGRRRSVVLELLVCEVALLLMLLLGDPTVMDIASYLIRCATPGLIYTSSLLALELYITPLRARAVGLVAAGYAGGGLLHSVKLLLQGPEEDVGGLLVIGDILVLGLLAAMCCFLPETKDCQLPQTVGDMPGVRTIKEIWGCGEGCREMAPLLDNTD